MTTLTQGTMTFIACDAGTDYFFCPTSGLVQLACGVNIAATAYMDISSGGLQLVLLGVVGLAQTNFLGSVAQLRKGKKRTPEDFHTVIYSYQALKVKVFIYSDFYNPM